RAPDSGLEEPPARPVTAAEIDSRSSFTHPQNQLLTCAAHTSPPLADKLGVSKTLLLCGAITLTLQAQTVTLTATPSSVSFTYQIGAALPGAQAVAVKYGSQTPGFTTSVTGANSLWLTAGPDSGKLPGNLSLRVNPTSLAVGTYSAAVTVTVAGV